MLRSIGKLYVKLTKTFRSSNRIFAIVTKIFTINVPKILQRITKSVISEHLLMHHY